MHSALIYTFLLTGIIVLIKDTDAAATFAANAATTASLNENNIAAAVVGAVTATSDANGTITYAIAQVPAGSLFTLSAAGAITVTAANSLDYETASSYTLTITATDSAGGTDPTHDLVLSVNDLNEEPPTFATSPLYVSINAASAAGTTLTTVTATDADPAAPNNEISSYVIIGGNTNTDFAVSAAGVITVATDKTLAKATTPGYSLVYEAADNGATKLTGTLTIHVAVYECQACDCPGVSVVDIRDIDIDIEDRPINEETDEETDEEIDLWQA